MMPPKSIGDVARGSVGHVDCWIVGTAWSRRAAGRSPNEQATAFEAVVKNARRASETALMASFQMPHEVMPNLIIMWTEARSLSRIHHDSFEAATAAPSSIQPSPGRALVGRRGADAVAVPEQHDDIR